MAHPEDLEYPEEAFRAGTWDSAPRRDVRRIRVVGVIVIVALLLLGGGVAWVGLALSARLASPIGPDVDSPRTVAAVQLVTGNCLPELPEHGDVRSVRVVPCTEEHRVQVWSQFAFAENAIWPGQDAADARVAASCQLPAELSGSGVYAVTWAPTAASWQRGDRTGLCLVVLPEATTESLFAPGTLGG